MHKKPLEVSNQGACYIIIGDENIICAPKMQLNFWYAFANKATTIAITTVIAILKGRKELIPKKKDRESIIAIAIVEKYIIEEHPNYFAFLGHQ